MAPFGSSYTTFY